MAGARKVSEFMNELADREAIRDMLLRYARASDRCDEDLLRSVYWPDAKDDHLVFSGNPEEFIAWSIPIMRAMRYNMHMIANMLITIDGEEAEAETYFQGYHSTIDAEGARRDVLAAGRYIDTLHKRDDEWRIFRRFCVVDWFREFPDSADWEKGPFGMQVTRGDLKPEDISYRLFKRL